MKMLFKRIAGCFCCSDWLFILLLWSTLVVKTCCSSSHRGVGEAHGHNLLRSILSTSSSNEFNSWDSSEQQHHQQQQQQEQRFLQVPPYPRKYHIRTSAEIKDKLDDWNSRYSPNFVHITTSQELYQLPAAGTADDCPFYQGEGCPNYIVTIQDFVAHPEGSYSSNRLPEVLWSGCLHGDERVGPTAVVEAADILLAAASCEALPKYPNNNGNSMSSTQKQQQLDEAMKCRQTLAEQGIDDAHRQWLARLVSTRRIIVVPTANALGYFQDTRTENNIDPNRDFPYDLTDPTECMQTIAARTLNEIFQEHLFQLSLTFHAGMEVIGYEWGAPSFLHKDSPDDKAQYLIATAYSQYAGGFSDTPQYKAGSMNSLVYPVNGGMEDWAYAGSFDPQHGIVCKPKTFGGYPPQKTKYTNGTLRVFNMLVETSDFKTPSKDTLGSNKDVLQGQELPSNGHIARNLRLALLAAEFVEPYLSITQVNDVHLSDDIVPLTDLKQDRATCQAIRTVQTPASVVQLQWTVGGVLRIDKTLVFYAKWDSLPEDALNCLSQPSLDYNLTDLMQHGEWVNTNHGMGYFNPSTGPIPPGKDDTKGTVLGPVFHGFVNLSSFAPHDRIAVVVGARVDSDWIEQPSTDNVEPKIPPQSHIVHARNDPNWHFENAGKHIQGRLVWYSMPLTIVIGSADSATTIELSNRMAASDIQNDKSNEQTSGDESGKRKLRQLSWTSVVGLLIIVAAVAGSCAVCVRSREHKRHQRIVNELYEDEDHFHDVVGGSGSKNKSKVIATANNYIYADQIDEDFDEDDDDDYEEDDDEVVGDLQLKLEQGKHQNGAGVASRNGEVEMQRYTID